MKWTLLKAGTEFGCSRETIRRGLAANGVAEKKTYSTREIHRALAGDLKSARAREAMANAKLKEDVLAEREGVLVEMAEVERLYGEALIPVRQRLLSMPAECATRANPTDPQFAREALQRWVDEALPIIREKLPKVSKKTK